jgi:hypothetical protein
MAVATIITNCFLVQCNRFYRQVFICKIFWFIFSSFSFSSNFDISALNIYTQTFFWHCDIVLNSDKGLIQISFSLNNVFRFVDKFRDSEISPRIISSENLISLQMFNNHSDNTGENIPGETSDNLNVTSIILRHFD